MSGPFSPFAPPIVGQPVKVFECVPMATVLCNCHPENVPFLIVGIEQAKICVRCRNVYAIGLVSFDRSKADAAVLGGVVCLGKQP